MAAKNGAQRSAGKAASFAMAAIAALAGGLCAQQSGDEIARLAALLAQPGPEGREARERAIERLLASDRPEAHAVLHARLRSADDPDGVRPAIVASLQRHVLLPNEAQFGGAKGSRREQLLGDWLRALAPSWRGLEQIAIDPGDDALRSLARTALQRLSARELDAVARTVIASGAAADKVDVLRCLADLQHLQFAPTLAEQLEATDAAVRAAAQRALQLLTCSEQPIATRDQFAAWLAANGGLRYVDVVERAARRGATADQPLRDELARVRVEAARDVVRALVVRAPGIDWAAVQARVCVDDAQVLDACLALLQSALPAVGDEASPARLQFARALLQRFHAEPPGATMRRAALLEVAAYVGRPEDTELAGELRGLLTAQLDVEVAAAQAAVLRGLRRLPSIDTRARLVALANRLLAAGPAAEGSGLLVQILTTLTTRATPRWTAPSPGDADKADWLRLVATACRSDAALGLREPALALSQTLDARDQRVPEVFDLLLELVHDAALETAFRATCAFHLQGWRNEAGVAEAWVKALQELLGDAVPVLRQQAAESLVLLAESTDPRRSDWIAATILAVRGRLATEADPAVFRTFVECVQDLGRQPLMPEKAIGALRFALAELRDPVPAEQQFRLEPLLQALASIGADARADRGQWLAACEPLLLHRRRQSLRLILQSHGAVDLAADVARADTVLAERARQAMRLILETATLKPAREAWSSSEELLQEARDVRTAFGALDAVDEAQRLDRPVHRLLRLDVDLAVGKPQDVVQRGTAWLGNGNGRSTMTPAERARLQALVAEAQLQLGRPAEARRLLEERGDEAPVDAALLDLEARVARALVPTDLAGAVAMLDRVLRRSGPEDPAFRARLVEWMQLRLRLDPESRDETLRAAEPHASLFAAADCPAELRREWEQLWAR
jgi:hypothetical protein